MGGNKLLYQRDMLYSVHDHVTANDQFVDPVEKEKRKLAQGQLAQLVGVDQSTVSYIEKGKRGISEATITAICHQLGIDT